MRIISTDEIKKLARTIIISLLVAFIIFGLVLTVLLPDEVRSDKPIEPEIRVSNIDTIYIYKEK